MQVDAEQEMTDLIQSYLPSLDEMEAAFIWDCWLWEPRMPLKKFSENWRLSGKAMTELRSRVLLRLRNLLAEKNIHSVVDIV
jgi:hypothetical protein